MPMDLLLVQIISNLQYVEELFLRMRLFLPLIATYNPGILHHPHGLPLPLMLIDQQLVVLLVMQIILGMDRAVFLLLMDDGQHGQDSLLVLPPVVVELNHKRELVAILLPQMEERLAFELPLNHRVVILSLVQSMDDGLLGQDSLLVLPPVVVELNHKRELVAILLPQMEERLVHELPLNHRVAILRLVQLMDDGLLGQDVMQHGHVLILVLSQELVLILHQQITERIVLGLLLNLVQMLDLLGVQTKDSISNFCNIKLFLSEWW